jgi:mannose-1-phosphate guanylyltransferase
LEKISVDYAIMEKAKAVRVIGSDFDWDDVGEWPAVERHYKRDTNNNVGKGNVVIQDGGGNIVMADGAHTVALVGVDDLIVVHTADATLVCRKDKAQDIKKLVKALGADAQYRHLL